MANLIVKCYLERQDLEVETRRFNLERNAADASGIFDVIYQKIGMVFPDLKGTTFSLYWKDLDDDFVTVSTNDEMKDAIANEVNGTCKIYIKVDEYQRHDPSMKEGTESAGQDDNGSSPAKKGDHQKADPWQDHPPPFAPHAGPFHHLPPPFRFHHGGPHSVGGFGGPWGWGRRGMRGPFHGFPGGHHHHHHHHKGPHHFGPKGHHFQGHCGMKHGDKHDKHGWKNALRAMVPMPHRRWAKSFIQNWRSENIKNATSTSDSEFSSDGKITMATAGVPQAYSDWLEIKLECWHKKWCSDEISGGTKFNKKAKKLFKESVPKEFRKWTKWYLRSHFGKREAPKFKKDCPKWNNMGGDRFKKEQFLNSQVPEAYQAWTKQFIKKWRSENKLNEPSSTAPHSSDSEGFDLEADMDVGTVTVMSVPEEYKQWLEVFLPRWHMWRGQLERNPDQRMKGGMGVFRDTVPFDFRAWVKCYLCKHYSKAGNGKANSFLTKDETEENYQNMLLAFKKKWIQDQKQSDEDSDPLISLSSDDEEDPKNKGEPETSFNRLSLNTDNAGKEKQRVHFKDKDDQKKKPKNSGNMDIMVEDDEEGNAMLYGDKKQMGPDFRRFAKQALGSWDGETLDSENDMPQGQEGAEGLDIPPNAYRWMSKYMMKMQMKQMKQQFKAAKREMKAAKK